MERFMEDIRASHCGPFREPRLEREAESASQPFRRWIRNYRGLVRTVSLGSNTSLRVPAGAGK